MKVPSRKAREIQARHQKRRKAPLASGKISGKTYRKAIERRKQWLKAVSRAEANRRKNPETRRRTNRLRRQKRAAR